MNWAALPRKMMEKRREISRLTDDCSKCGLPEERYPGKTYCKRCHNRECWARKKRLLAVDPEAKRKNDARNKLRVAVFSGRIRKPNRCQNCRARKPLEGHHHHGYARWDLVRWLCRTCHTKEHRKAI